MNSTVIRNGLRFLGLVLVQGLILQNIGVSWKEFPYMNLFIYPLFVLVLPLRAPATLVIFLGFLMGITVDVFYNSLGIHAFAMTFTAYIRPFILRQIEPRSGYNNNYSPTIRRYGNAWFAKYAAIMLGIHCFIYFFVEAFTPYYMADIIIKTLVCFILSFGLIYLVHLIFNSYE